MTTTLVLPEVPAKSWVEECVCGYTLRYSVDQPAPNQWVAVGLLYVAGRTIFLAMSAPSEAAALAGLHARVIERIDREAAASSRGIELYASDYRNDAALAASQSHSPGMDGTRLP